MAVSSQELLPQQLRLYPDNSFIIADGFFFFFYSRCRVFPMVLDSAWTDCKEKKKDMDRLHICVSAP